MGGGWSVLEADYGEGVFLFGFSLLSELLSALGAGGTPSLYLSPGGGEIGLCRVEGWVVVVMGAFMRGSRRRGVTGLAWHKWAWRDRLWIPACAGMTGGRCWLVRQGFACVAGLDVVG